MARVGCAAAGRKLAPGFQYLLVAKIGRHPKCRPRAFLALDAAAGGHNSGITLYGNT